jgi:hypothetical protein
MFDLPSQLDAKAQFPALAVSTMCRATRTA